MLTEKSTMTTEAIFSDDRQYRYLLRKEWDAQKKKAMVIMTNPSTADLLTLDYTTLYIINNLVKLDFGSVEIVNLVSKTTTKLNIKEDIPENLEDENVTQIIKSAEKSDNVIIAYGRLGNSSSTVNDLQNKLLEHLKPYADKLYQICDDNGEFGFHPLAPSVRFVWNLVKFEIPQPPPPTAEVKPIKKAKNKKSQKGHEEVPVQETTSEDT